MDFVALKEQIKEQLAATWDKIQEHQAYGQFMEKYESLPPIAQKAFVGAILVLFAYILLSIPMSFFSSSTESIEDFETNRNTIRELLKTTSIGKGVPAFRSGPSQSGLANRVRSTISSQGYLEDQITSVEPFDASNLNLGPKSIEKFGVEAKLSQLNLNEIISVGYELQRLTKGVKLIGMDMTANAKDDHYFDVVFRLVSFKLPEQKVEKKPEKKKSRRNRRRSRK